MKATSILSTVLASAAVASAQGSLFICEKEDAAYCAGGSLSTDIIFRCNGKVGQPGRCSNNLAGQPPLGSWPSLCWQTSPTSGDAACAKNCVVYGASGNYNGTFTLPADVCTPFYTATASSSSSPSTASVAPSSVSVSSSAEATTEEATDTHTEQTETSLPTTTGTGNPPTGSSSSEPPHSSSSGSEPPHSSPSSSSSSESTATTQTTALTNPPLTTATTATVETTAPTNPPVVTAAAAVKGQAAAGALVVLAGVVAVLF